jgi:hypothetical protein
VLQVAARNLLAQRMTLAPIGTLFEKLLDLVLTYPIVLLVIEYRDKQIEMGKQCGKPDFAAQPQPEAVALAPLGKPLASAMR